MTPSLDTGCRVGGVTDLLVSEHPGFGSDPPIGSDQRRGVTRALISESFAFFALFLYSASVAMASMGARVGGHMGFMKNFGGSRLEELGMPSGTSGWSP